MAGLWDSTTVGVRPDRLNVTLLRTELVGVALGVKTQAEARSTLDQWLTDQYTTPIPDAPPSDRVLEPDELSDLSAIATQITTGNTLSRLVYAHKLEYALNAAELKLIDEVEFRTVRGI